MSEHSRHDEEESTEPSPLESGAEKDPQHTRRADNSKDLERPIRTASGSKLPIPDGETHVIPAGSLNLTQKPRLVRKKTKKLLRPEATDKRPTDTEKIVKKKKASTRTKTAKALKKIARIAPPSPSRGIPRPVTAKKKRPDSGKQQRSPSGKQARPSGKQRRPASGKQARPSGRQQRPSGRQQRPSERLKRPSSGKQRRPSGRTQRSDGGPQALSAEEFRELKKSLSLEGPAKELFEGAIHIVSIGEAILNRVLCQGDIESAKKYAARLAQTALAIKHLFNTRLENEETRRGFSDNLLQIDLMKIATTFLTSPSSELIEDIIDSLEESSSQTWGANETDITQLKRCFSEALYFTSRAVKFMKKKSEDTRYKEIHHKALAETSSVLSFMLCIPSREKDERYNDRIQERTENKVIREFNIRMLTALLQNAPALEQPIDGSRELGNALGEIVEIKEWLARQGIKLLQFMPSKDLTEEDRNRFLKALIGIARDEDFRELTFEALNNRSFIGLALSMREDTQKSPIRPKIDEPEPEIDGGHVRHVLARAQHTLIAQGKLPAETERMYPIPETNEVYLETRELEAAIEKAKKARERVKEQAKLLPSAPQGSSFNPFLELRNRGVAILRQKIADEDINRLTESRDAMSKAKDVLSSYEELTKEAARKAYDPTNKAHIDAAKAIPSETLQAQRSTLVAELEELSQSCNTYAKEMIAPECEAITEELQQIKEAFPTGMPLSKELQEGLTALLETPRGKPTQQEGNKLEFRSENFTTPCLHGRGPLGDTEGERAYGIIYTAEKITINASGAIEKTPVRLGRCYIHEKYLPALQEKINGRSERPPGSPTALYVVSKPLESAGFAARSVFVEYPAETTLPPPDAKGNFLTAAHLRIESPLAQGGFGFVYRGINAKGEIIVVKAGIKTKDDQILKREHKIGQKLKTGEKRDHPAFASSSRVHISTDSLAIYGITEGRLLLEIPFAEGTDPLNFCLEEAKQAGVDLEHTGQYMLWITELVVEIGLLLTNAMAYSHGKGIAHLDIKPENIRITRDENGRVSLKLIDLGSARDLGETSIENSLPFSAPETCEVIVPKDPEADIEIKPYIVVPRIDICNVGATLGALLLKNPDLWKVDQKIKALPNPGPHDILTLVKEGIFASSVRAKQSINPFDHDYLKKEEPTVKDKTIMFKPGHPTELLLKLLRKATHPNALDRIQDISELQDGLTAIKGLIKKIKADTANHKATLSMRRAEEEAYDRNEAQKKAEAETARAKAEAEQAAEKKTRLAEIKAQMPRQKKPGPSTGAFSRAELGLEPKEQTTEETAPSIPVSKPPTPVGGSKILRGSAKYDHTGELPQEDTSKERPSGRITRPSGRYIKKRAQQEDGAEEKQVAPEESPDETPPRPKIEPSSAIMNRFLATGESQELRGGIQDRLRELQKNPPKDKPEQQE
jgi:serine/threonine protein kinase